MWLLIDGLVVGLAMGGGDGHAVCRFGCWRTEPGRALLAGELHVAAPPPQPCPALLLGPQDPSFFLMT